MFLFLTLRTRDQASIAQVVIEGVEDLAAKEQAGIETEVINESLEVKTHHLHHQSLPDRSSFASSMILPKVSIAQRDLSATKLTSTLAILICASGLILPCLCTRGRIDLSDRSHLADLQGLRDLWRIRTSVPIKQSRRQPSPILRLGLYLTSILNPSIDLSALEDHISISLGFQAS